MAYTEDVNVNLNVLTGTMSGVTAIMGGMSALTSSFGAMGTAAADSFGALDGLLVSATALLTTFAVQSAEAYGQFEQGMKIVQAVSGQTGSAISELSTKANELSINYRTAIGDITDGLQTLGRAGLKSAETQLDVLESGLQTAKLEGRNLNSVLEEIIQNTAMLGGDLKSIDFGAQSEYLNSLLVGTSMTAPITSHDISQTLQYAGGTAAAAGANLDSAEGKKKLEDLMGTVAAFAQKGVTGSMAGTALRAFFTKPASQDKGVTEGLSRIGLKPEDLWENGGESMKSVSDQIGLIQRQMDKLNMSTMDQVELWGKIVGPKMGQQMMKLESSSIKSLTRDIQSASSAEELATQTLQTYTQKLAEMQQQGDLAFRNFGQKAAFWLTPVVEIINKILGLLSHPIGNLAAFSAVGITLGHGFSKAWTMITTLYGQIRTLISDTIAGIQNINSLAGGGAAGFTQTASSVDFLNAKLAHTNAELAAMQSQFLKFGVSATGTGVMPLGIVGPNGRVPANMIDYAPQNVLRMGGVRGEGRFYDQSEEKQFRRDFTQRLHEENNKKINSAIAKHYDENTGRYRGGNGIGQPGQFIKRSVLEEHYGNKFALSNEEITKQADVAVKSGQGQVHSTLRSMTMKEYKAWMKDLQNSTKALAQDAHYQKGGRYVDEKGNYTKAYHQDMLKAENLKRQQEFERNAAKEGNIHRSTVNGQQFMRANVMHLPQERMYEVERAMQKEAQLKQFEQQRSNVINQQKALAQGTGIGLKSKGVQVFEQRIKKYSDALNWGTNKVKSIGTAFSHFGNSIKRTVGLFELDTPKMMEKLDAVITSIETQMKEVPITFEEAVIQIQEELGVTSAELSTIFTETAVGMELFNERLVALGLTTVEGEIVTATNSAAIAENTLATEMNSGSKIKNAFSSILSGAESVVGFMGGPLMAGMLGVTVAMSAIQHSQQAWQERMQEATNELSEATDKMSEASDKIKEIYSSENENITEADLDKAVDEQYATVAETFYGANGIGHYETNRDDLGRAEFDADISMAGKYDEATNKYEMLTEDEIASRQESTESITLSNDDNIKALNENTMALVEATAAYNKAENKQVKEFDDSSWGANSTTANFVDKLGEWQEEIWNVGSWADGVDRRAGFFDTNSPVLSGSQADSNYAGSTDFAAIFAMDTMRFGVDQGLRQFFGSDFDRIMSLMGEMDNKIGAYGTMGGKSALMTHANNMANMDSKDMAIMQMHLKNNPEDFQKLGKQAFRYEQSRGLKSGHTAYEDWQTGKLRQRVPGTRKGDKNAWKEISKAKFTVQDKNMDRTLKKIMSMTDNKLSYQNVLAMAQLQQLQDMYMVANETVAPGIMQTVQGVYSNVSATGSASDNAGSASSGAASAAANAAAIASLLGAQAQGKAEEAAYDEWKRDSNSPQMINGVKITDQDTFVKAISKGGEEGNKWQSKIFQSLSGGGWSLQHPGATPEAIKSNAERLAGSNSDLMKSNASYQDKLNTATRMIVNYAQGATLAAYDQSNIGEYGGGQRQGSGGGGGSGGDGDGGSGGSDSGNKGTTTNRVDLVLCNKKTIPKLNVNLFKKPPQFTIKNKQFSVRDININTQDKPDAMVDAVKDSIIRTQQRMDPKIVQDEQAVYDPAAATDGTTTPKGKTAVKSK